MVDVHGQYVEAIPQVTCQQAANAAITLYRAALRRWRVKEIAELSPARRANLIDAVHTSMRMLGIEAMVIDFNEIDNEER